MKKMISILLALAVILSFTACENKVVFPENTDRTVLSVTLESAPEYIVGETLNPADVTLRVVFGDKTEDTFTGAELGLIPEGTKTTSYTLAKENTFKVNYGVKEKSDGTKEAGSWDIPVTATTITSLVVDPTNGAKTVVVNSTPSTEGLVFNATCKNGLKRAVSYDVAKANISDLAFEIPSGAAVDSTATVSAKGTGVTISPSWEVKVVAAADHNAIVSVALKQVVEEAGGNGSNEIFNEVGGSDTLNDVNFVVEITRATSGMKAFGKDEFTTEEIAVVWNLYTNDYPLDGDAPSYFDATVTIGTGDDAYVAKNVRLNVEYTKDYATKYKAVPKSDSKTYWYTDEIKASDFTFYATEWASDKALKVSTGDAISDQSVFEVPAQYKWVKQPATSGTTQAVGFVYTGTGHQSVTADENSVKTVNLKDPSIV